MKTATILAAALTGVLAFTSARAADLTPAEESAIAEEAYVFGFAPVEHYKALWAYGVEPTSLNYGGFNVPHSATRLYGPDDKAVVSANNDTIYTSAAMDLRAEPVVLQVPEVADRYVLTFAPGAMAPVKYFWSVTMYDAKSQLPVHNLIERYSIGDRTPGLKTAPDGSLTLHLQHESPGKESESNWLPAPNAPFYVILRAYGPKDEILTGTYKIPAIRLTK